MKNMNCLLYRMPAMHYNTILMQELEDISYKTIKLIPINYAAVEKCSKNTRKGHCKILSTIDQVPADQKCKYNSVTHTLCGLRVHCLEYTVVKLCEIYK